MNKNNLLYRSFFILGIYALIIALIVSPAFRSFLFLDALNDVSITIVAIYSFLFILSVILFLRFRWEFYAINRSIVWPIYFLSSALFYGLSYIWYNNVFIYEVSYSLFFLIGITALYQTLLTIVLSSIFKLKYRKIFNTPYIILLSFTLLTAVVFVCPFNGDATLMDLSFASPENISVSMEKERKVLDTEEDILKDVEITAYLRGENKSYTVKGKRGTIEGDYNPILFSPQEITIKYKEQTSLIIIENTIPDDIIFIDTSEELLEYQEEDKYVFDGANYHGVYIYDILISSADIDLGENMDFLVYAKGINDIYSSFSLNINSDDFNLYFYGVSAVNTLIKTNSTQNLYIGSYGNNYFSANILANNADIIIDSFGSLIINGTLNSNYVVSAKNLTINSYGSILIQGMHGFSGSNGLGQGDDGRDGEPGQSGVYASGKVKTIGDSIYINGGHGGYGGDGSPFIGGVFTHNGNGGNGGNGGCAIIASSISLSDGTTLKGGFAGEGGVGAVGGQVAGWNGENGTDGTDGVGYKKISD